MKYNYEKVANDYLTPPILVDKALSLINEQFGTNRTEFDLDTCCTYKNIPSKDYIINGERDGLKEEWSELNWCNPPFDKCKQWIEKAFTEQHKGRTTMMLVPFRCETKFFHDYVLYNDFVKIFWLRKGYKFINAETKEEMGVFKNALALILFIGVKYD